MQVHGSWNVLSPQGIRPNRNKVEAIKSFPILCKIRQHRSFLGMIGYYCKFIRNFAVIAKPLYGLAKTDVLFQWSETCDKAFNKLKQKILSTDVLGFLNFKKPFILATDMSTTGLGGCLYQEVDGVLKPVGFPG